jgi:zinc protease
MSYTLTTQVGNVTVTRITPLTPAIVRFSLTAKIQNGATRFTQSTLSLYSALLFTKTKRKSKLALEEYQRKYGITLEVTTGIESITFTGSVRREHVNAITALVKELVFEPLVDAKEFVAKKKLALEANREAHDNAKRAAQTAFVNALYPHEPRLILDTLTVEKKHIGALTEAHIRALHTALPKAVWFLSIVGDTEAEYGFLPLARALAKSAGADERSPITAFPAPASAHYTTVHGKTNIEVQMGNVGTIRNDDPSFVAFDFGIDVLGKLGGFSGRLMSTVREKEGLTYGIYALIHSHHRGDSFHFVVRTFFMAKDYEKGIAAIKRELTAIVEKGITEQELAVFKEINRNEYILAHESNATRLTLYHSLTVRGQSEAHYREFEEQIAKLTRKEVNDALRKNIDLKNLVLSAAGPILKDGTPILTQKA